ncbi:uncharacterized protein BDZ99DRAFT_467546 [Mytilinidion resinicola]|uniref:SnoaL-like domain-containing protein n=1 Tax=Mytilinidion resinicola TaxID=574789 RepID=A0A6A6Y879_9PEZI|nr:uncharacterized protein BDZ99DRAFT_467546 [Mytilinidion resinicola]KAF2804174.1 hypothetical protein BDZ99DRAFT_467546 [Mytilinidion resinicola]
MPPYPTAPEISAIFKNMETGNYPEVFKRVSPNVDWTVMGTHPCAGRYTTLAAFQKGTLKRLGAIMKEPGIKLKVRNVIGGGEQAWAVVELVADAECKNGMPFENTYAWCVRFDEEGMVVQVRAYLDSAMVKQAVEENEGPCESFRAKIE